MIGPTSKFYLPQLVLMKGQMPVISWLLAFQYLLSFLKWINFPVSGMWFLLHYSIFLQELYSAYNNLLFCLSKSFHHRWNIEYQLIFFYLLVLWPHPAVCRLWRLLLALESRMTLEKLRAPYILLRINLWLTACKTNTLTLALSAQCLYLSIKCKPMILFHSSNSFIEFNIM